MYAPVLMYYSCDFDFAEIHILGMFVGRWKALHHGRRLVSSFTWYKPVEKRQDVGIAVILK